MKTSISTYKFANGTFTITKGITTKFDWAVSVDLNKDENGNKQFFYLKPSQSIFLTKRFAKANTIELLNKYNLL